MILRPFALALALLGAACAQPLHAQPADGKPQSLPVTKIRVGGHAVDAEVASTPPERQVGLMYRFSLPADRGMLFVFAEPQPLSFWMRNTYVPLSIAFIDAQGRILNIEDMAPRDETGVPSRGLALYALEMRKGWFAERGVRPGTQVTGLPGASKY
ncbi:MAG: DUF192 domain-containing protein [Burkholderiales bacterium]|nr:DUF192 domain-containing protein [Burkholderiales bacterium]MCE7876367.1 DUF192 domain-containing protein [Betaproteobacteria bacterium PRO3]